jgi:hypothetical protein
MAHLLISALHPATIRTSVRFVAGCEREFLRRRVPHARGIRRCQAQRSEMTLAEALAKGSRAGSELCALRAEHASATQTLVAAKLELAQLGEREVVMRRELYKAREANLRLAAKMAKLEATACTSCGARGSAARR